MPLHACTLQRTFISIGLLLMLITVNLCHAHVADQQNSDENCSLRADAHTHLSPEGTPPHPQQAAIGVEDTTICGDADVSEGALHRICRKARTRLTRR
jgi:hypothetical protein